MDTALYVVAVVAEYTGSQRVRCAVRDINRLVDALGAHKQKYGCEELGLSNLHVPGAIGEEGGLEVVTFWVEGVMEAVAAAVESCATVYGGSDQGFEASE